MIAAWCGVTPDKLPPEMRAHTCAATAAAWGRVADAARAHLASEVQRAREEALTEIAKWQKPQHVRLHAGEMTAQEMRSVQAVLGAIVRSLSTPPAEPAGGHDAD